MSQLGAQSKDHRAALQNGDVTRDFKIQQCGWQRGRQKNNRFYKQNNNFAHAPRFYVHFSACVCKTTTSKCLISCFMEYNNNKLNFVSLSALGYGP